MNRIVGTLVVALAVVAAGSTAAQADTLNCTSGTCLGGTPLIFNGVNYASFAGALWSVTDTQPTGSGVIDSFVRIGGNTEAVDGMNTSYRTNGPNKGLLNDEKTDLTFTHDIQIGQIPKVTLGGVDYYQFLLDINQTGSDPLLSMSQVKICTGSSGSLPSMVDTCDDAGNASTLKYNLDSPTKDNNILMDYSLNNGSGSGDLFMYIPTGTLGVSPNKYVYLWSQFGLPSPDGNNDGYEEWAVKANLGSVTPFNALTTPEPASLILLGSGLVAGGGYLRRSRKKAASQKLT